MRLTRSVAALAVVGLLAAACGGDDDNEGGVRGDVTTATEDAGTAAAATGTDDASATSDAGGSTAADGSTTPGGSAGTAESAPGGADSAFVTEGVDRDATIRIALTNALNSTDPHSAIAGAGAAYLRLLYDNLFVVVDGELRGELVTDWQLDEGSLVLTLGDDATFHDGTPIDATAVKANLDRVRTGATSGYVADLASILSVDVVDDVTVRLNLAPKSGATLPYALTSLAGAIINPSFFDPETLRTSAPDGAGSGPYKVASWTSGESSVVFERAPQHWDLTAGQAARIEIDVLDPIQALNEVETGTYDITGTNVLTAEDAIGRVESSPDQVHVNLVGNPSAQGMWLQDRADATVREAMGYALDRDALVALFGEVATVTNQLYAPGDPLYVEEIDERHHYDPDHARELMATVPEEAKTVTVGFNPAPPGQQLNELVQAQMAAVGINMEIQPLQVGALFEAWHGGQIDALALSVFVSPLGATTLSRILLPGPGLMAAPESALPELEAQLATADDPALSDDERNQIYRDVMQRIADENWLLVLFQTQPGTFSKADIVNLDVSLDYSFSNYRYAAKLAE